LFLRQSVREVTADTYVKRVKRLGKLGNIDSPDHIKALICTYQAKESYKELLAEAYDYYVNFRQLNWSKPRFSKTDSPIFLPLESELDQLISHSRLKMSVFLQLLKETGADSGEAWQTRWIDINPEHRTVAIHPTKNHLSRTLPISCNLMARLFQLHHKGDYVFGGGDIEDFRNGYSQMRGRLADKVNSERLRQVAFRSFRHWKATTEYAKTRDILHIKWLLGHRRIENTMVYTHLISFGTDDYACKVAHNVEECTALIEAGFEHVTDCEGAKLFRKRK